MSFSLGSSSAQQPFSDFPPENKLSTAPAWIPRKRVCGGFLVCSFFFCFFLNPSCGQTTNMLPALLTVPSLLKGLGFFRVYYCPPLTPAQLFSLLFATSMLWKTLPDQYVPSLKATDQPTFLPKPSSPC